QINVDNPQEKKNLKEKLSQLITEHIQQNDIKLNVEELQSLKAAIKG
ncbi:unnamed protein product, partial [Didymodactylos carnosus]